MALEFETMLRRHLKSGGAPVAVCAGFDFDAASAYLEDALGGSQRAGYESHLAGCAACRRHLIELSRLAKTISHAGTQPAIVADKTPAWVRWREVVAGWFDLSGWNRKWQMIGAVGAAFAILIAALGVQSWWQGSRQAHSVTEATAVVANQSQTGEGSQTPSSPAPTSESLSSSLQDAQLLASGNSVAGQQGRSRVPVPTPLVGPITGELAVPVEPKTESLKLNSNQQSVAPPFSFISRPNAPANAQQSISGVPQGQVSSLGGFSRLVDNPDNNNKNVVLDLRAGSREQATDLTVEAERKEISNDITARITPPPGNNPMNPEPTPTPPRGKSQPEKTSPRPSRLIWTFVPWSKSDPKSESGRRVKLEPLDDESFKPLIHRIRGKVFRFNPDLKMWIDQDYKDEMLWRVSKLTRGSKQYEQILANDPALKEFFDHGPILIIWKQKIYKVR